MPDNSASQSEKPPDPEIATKWTEIVYNVYQRMIHASEVSFFLSTPQMISTIGFLSGSCGSEKAKALICDYVEGKKKYTGGIEIDPIISDVVTLVKSWNLSLNSIFGPGYFRHSRRVYAYPKFMHPHNENSFQMFRKFNVEEKVFENRQEVEKWVQKTLKVEFADNQKCLITWKYSENPPHMDRKKKVKKGVIETLSAKLTTPKPKRKHEYSSWKTSGKNPVEQEKRAPILAWISHANIGLPERFFDVQNIYVTKDKNDGEFLRVFGKVSVEKCDKEGVDFSTLFLPTQNPNLTLIIIYDFGKELCLFKTLTNLVTTHRKDHPVIVKPEGEDSVEEKKDVYFPFWQTRDFSSSRIAQHLVGSSPILASFFVPDGFGDLAVPEAVPSSSGDPKRVSHVQHFALLTVKNRPKGQRVEEIRQNRVKIQKLVEAKRHRIQGPEDPQTELIQYPICVMLWDNKMDLPAYMGMLTGKPPDYQIELMEKKRELSKQKNKVFC